MRVRAGRSIGGGRRLQDRRLCGVGRVLRDATSRRSLRSIRLGGRQMRRMDIHVGRGVIHAADGERSRIVALTDGIRIFRRASRGKFSRRRRSSVVVINGSRRARQTGASAGGIGTGDHRVRIAGPIGRSSSSSSSSDGRLRGCRQAESRKLVAGQQRTIRRVMVVPRDISRTSGVDLRDRWELQFFGLTGTGLKRSKYGVGDEQ